MIRGIGVDVLALKRLQGYEGRWNDSFFTAMFTERERAEALERDEPLRYFAGRFAAKEAVAKALNAHGIAVEFPQIETLAGPHGAPETQVTGDAAAASGIALHVSISHEDDFVLAFAVAEEC